MQLNFCVLSSVVFIGLWLKCGAAFGDAGSLHLFCIGSALVLHWFFVRALLSRPPASVAQVHAKAV